MSCAQKLGKSCFVGLYVAPQKPSLGSDFVMQLIRSYRIAAVTLHFIAARVGAYGPGHCWLAAVSWRLDQ